MFFIKKHSKFLLSILLSCMLSSCASLLNGPYTSIAVVTSEPANVVVDSDSFKILTERKNINVKRSAKPLTITAYNDSISKTVKVASKNSPLFWLNLSLGYLSWVGFIVDNKTNRGYTYPDLVYIDMSKKNKKYDKKLPEIKQEPLMKYKNTLKFTPLKICGIINPSVELGYERRTGDYFSTQLMASRILPNNILFPNIPQHQFKGYMLSLEERCYFYKQTDAESYLGFEVNFLRNNYYNILEFNPNLNWDDSLYYESAYLDTVLFKREKLAFNFKLGGQFNYGKFLLDVYVGIGIGYRNVQQFERINSEHEEFTDRHPTYTYAMNIPGKYWTVTMPLNLRLGYVF